MERPVNPEVIHYADRSWRLLEGDVERKTKAVREERDSALKKLDDVQKELANAQKELDDTKLQLEEALRRNSELECQIRTTENSEHMRPDLLHGQNS